MSRELRKETANKGFSLVELIIVVAIMAVLIGILAPQYIKYVEKSRLSSDQTTTDEFVKAMQVLASDTDVTLTAPATGATSPYTVTSNSDGAITISGDLQTAFTTAGSIDLTKTYKFQSAAFKADPVTITLQYDSTNKVWSVERKGGSF